MFTVELIDLFDGENFIPDKASELFSRCSSKDIDRLRLELTRQNKRKELVRVRCRFCREPLFLKAARNFNSESQLFFSHFKASDHTQNQCPQRTAAGVHPDILRAMKFNGAQESQLHFSLKSKIHGILQSDPLVPVESVKLEKRLSDSTWWRKPDVQAVINGVNVAFEVQVSTEFVTMIAEREWFYEATESVAILWILPAFTPDNINRSQLDILVSNNDHLFVLPKALIERSVNERQLLLECWIHMPYRSGHTLLYRWEQRVVSVHDISFVDGHPLLLDTRKIENEIKQEIEQLPAPVEHLPAPAFTRLSQDERAFITRWQEVYQRIVALPTRQILPWLMEEGFYGDQTKYVSGIWLRSRGIHWDWSSVECNNAIAKALISADTLEIQWPKQTWKWVTKMVAQHHPAWLAPYHNLLKTFPPYRDVLESDRQVQDALIQCRGAAPLSDQSKALLAVLCPRLHLPVQDPLPLSDADDHGLCYPVHISNAHADGFLVSPPEFKHRERQIAESSLDAGLNELNDKIEKSLWETLSRPKGWAPMPNLPSVTSHRVEHLPIQTQDIPGLLEKFQLQCAQLKERLVLVE